MASQPLVQITDASLSFGSSDLWRNLNLAVEPGEFIAVLGPNGAGKTSLLQALLGLLPLSAGDIRINGQAARRGNKKIGYIPQGRSFDASIPIRGFDLVELGLNGQHYGYGHTKKAHQQVQQAIASVGASEYAFKPMGVLSGGQQQRLRIAQALVSEPELLLCDEPLLSLDLSSQQSVTKLISDYKESHQAAVLFVTHEINPILPWVDRILYLANGSWVIDKPSAVLNSKTLSRLYGTAIDVLEIRGRILVVGTDDGSTAETGAHHHNHGDSR